MDAIIAPIIPKWGIKIMYNIIISMKPSNLEINRIFSSFNEIKDALKTAIINAKGIVKE